MDHKFGIRMYEFQPIYQSLRYSRRRWGNSYFKKNRFSFPSGNVTCRCTIHLEFFNSSTAGYTNVSTRQKLVKKCLHSDRSGS